MDLPSACPPGWPVEPSPNMSVSFVPSICTWLYRLFTPPPDRPPLGSVVDTCGVRATKSVKLRFRVGSRCIAESETVVRTPVRVGLMSAVDDEDLAVMAPSSTAWVLRPKSTRVAWPSATLTVRVSFAKPMLVVVTSYVPVSRPGTR